MKANSKYIRISPRKASLVAGIVRGMKLEEALDLLKFMPKKAAQIIRKILLSAAANAENNLKIDRSKLYVKTILVNKAPTFKRGQPVSRGRWHPIKKRNCHISVELDLVGAPAPKVASPKTAKKSTKKVADNTKKA